MTHCLPDPSRCPRCGGAFACAIASGACWCAQLPALRELPPGLGARCLCPACLRELIAAQALEDRGGAAAGDRVVEEPPGAQAAAGGVRPC